MEHSPFQAFVCEKDWETSMEPVNASFPLVGAGGRGTLMPSDNLLFQQVFHRSISS